MAKPQQNGRDVVLSGFRARLLLKVVDRGCGWWMSTRRVPSQSAFLRVEAQPTAPATERVVWLPCAVLVFFKIQLKCCVGREDSGRKFPRGRLP